MLKFSLQNNLLFSLSSTVYLMPIFLPSWPYMFPTFSNIFYLISKTTQLLILFVFDYLLGWTSLHMSTECFHFFCELPVHSIYSFLSSQLYFFFFFKACLFLFPWKSLHRIYFFFQFYSFFCYIFPFMYFLHFTFTTFFTFYFWKQYQKICYCLTLMGLNLDSTL